MLTNIVIIGISLAIHGVQCKKKGPVHEVFDVKPGGTQYEYELKGHGVSCKFTYACQGGTNEEWTFDIDKDGKKTTCTVSRPGGTSYLYFQQFKLEATGGKATEGKAMASERELGSEEYQLIDNSIIHAEGKFGSQLSGVSLTVERHKKKNDEF